MNGWTAGWTEEYMPYVLSTAAFLPKRQSRIVGTEILQTTKPKIFTILLFTEKSLMIPEL